MSYETEVVCLVTVDGMHRWPNAPRYAGGLDTKALVDTHRHLFEIRVSAVADGPNRQIEFFDLRRELKLNLSTLYPCDPFGLFDFGHRSCEHIAIDIMDRMPVCHWCSVYEDGENGAEVTRV